jgi:hypothetical protein
VSSDNASPRSGFEPVTPVPLAIAMMAPPATERATATRKSGAGSDPGRIHAAAVTTIGVTLASTLALATDV